MSTDNFTNAERISFGNDLVSWFCKKLKIRRIPLYVNPREWLVNGQITYGQFSTHQCGIQHSIPNLRLGPHIHVSIKLDVVGFAQTIFHELIHYWQSYATSNEQERWYRVSRVLSYGQRYNEVEAYSFARSIVDSLMEVTEIERQENGLIGGTPE